MEHRFLVWFMRQTNSILQNAGPCLWPKGFEGDKSEEKTQQEGIRYTHQILGDS